MRLAAVGLILSLALPASVAGKVPPRQQCLDRNERDYQLCQNRATTKNARKACKVNKKSVKKQCNAR